MPFIGLVVPALLAPALIAQQPAADSSFFRKTDGRLAIATIGATAAIALFDERIARWTRQPSVQGDSGRHDLVKTMTVINEMPLTAGAIATFGIGRLAGWRTVADVGLHVTESLVATELVAEGIRVAVGRVRPRASQDDAFVFDAGAGLTRFENRAFPSLHAAVAFATAASLIEEVRVRDSTRARYAAPALYALAMVPGLTRLYLDQHWASDVLAGTVLGAFLGSRITRYAHGRRTRLDRFLLRARVAPHRGGVNVGWSFDH